MSQSDHMERYLRSHAAASQPAEETAQPEYRFFITISRQAGAGGHVLAEELLELFANSSNERLFGGWQIFDRELCELVTADPAYSASLESLLAEEYRTKTNDFFEQIFRSTVDQDLVMRRVFATVRAVASLGKAIILGRGGSEVTRDMEGGVSVRLIAPEERRVRGVMEHYHLDEPEARAEARRLDDARARLLKTHFKVDIADAERYDMVVNTGEVAIGAAAEMIKVFIEARARSREALTAE